MWNLNYLELTEEDISRKCVCQSRSKAMCYMLFSMHTPKTVFQCTLHSQAIWVPEDRSVQTIPVNTVTKGKHTRSHRCFLVKMKTLVFRNRYCSVPSCAICRTREP